MASTANPQHSAPAVVTHAFTSASTAVDEVVTFGFMPRLVIYMQNITGTNPNVHVGSLTAADANNENLLITGSTGVITSPAHTAGVSIGTSLTASDSNGSITGQVTIDAGAQTNDGINLVLAIR